MLAAGHDFARMQDYIVGRLSDEERRAFEDRLVSDPELVRELEHSLRMREGLQQLRAQGYFAGLASRGWSFRLWLPAVAAAAVTALALFLWAQRERGASAVLMASLGSPGGVEVAPPVTAHFTFLSVRDGSTPELDLPPAGLIEIRAAPASRVTGQRYRVTLVRGGQGGSAETVAALSGLPLRSDGYVYCFAAASRLTPGDYVLRIEPPAATPEEFPFNLRARGTQPAR